MDAENIIKRLIEIIDGYQKEIDFRNIKIALSDDAKNFIGSTRVELREMERIKHE